MTWTEEELFIDQNEWTWNNKVDIKSMLLIYGFLFDKRYELWRLMYQWKKFAANAKLSRDMVLSGLYAQIQGINSDRKSEK